MPVPRIDSSRALVHDAEAKRLNPDAADQCLPGMMLLLRYLASPSSDQ